MSSQSLKVYLDIINKCLQNNNEIRNEGEKQIKQLLKTNFGEALLNCSLILMGEDLDLKSRQMGSNILKNSIRNQESIQDWELLPYELKEQIKINVLSCLGSSNHLIHKSAASSVSAIAKIDLPRGEWNSLIKTLSSAAQHTDINFQLTAITTLGYISQEISSQDISFEERQLIINTIIPAMNNSQNQALLLQSIKSLTFLIDYLYENMKNDEFRKCLFSKLFEYIKSSDEELALSSFQCLIDICRVYYDDIFLEFDIIAKFTLSYMRDTNEKLGIQAIIFWMAISDEELARINVKRNMNKKPKLLRQYCQMYKDNLWNEIKLILLNRDIQKEVKDEDTKYKSVANLIDNLSRCIDKEIIDKVFSFMSECFVSDDNNKNNIAIYAFTAILETCYEEEIKKVIPHSIPKMIELIKKDNQELQYTIALCLVKMCEFHADCFMKSELFNALIGMIKLNLHLTQRVVLQLVCSIHYLSKNIKALSYADINPFTPFLSELLPILLTLAYTPNAYNKTDNVALYSFLAIGTLIEQSSPCDQKVILEFFASIYEAFQKSLDKSTFNNNEEMRNDYQGYLASIISAYTTNNLINISKEQGELLYNLIRSSFDERKSVYEEGLIACSSLADTMKENYSSTILNNFMNYLLFSLKNWSDSSICNKAFLSVGDLIRSIGPNILPFIPTIMDIIMEIIAQDTDKTLKLKAILVFTDMFLNLEMKVWNYYPMIMSYIVNALEAAVLLPDENDQDLYEYYQLLRERLLEFITCILKIIDNNQIGDKFHVYLQASTSFIEKITSSEYEPSVDIALNAIIVINQFCKIYGNEMNSLISDKCIHCLTKILLKTNNKDIISLVELTQQAMLRIRIKAQINEYEKYS